MGQVAGSERRAPRAVLKFGSSVLRSPADLPWAVQEIYAHVRRGERVVAVVSAFAGRTDALYAAAREHGDCERATAALVAGGELESTALLTLALERAGVPARLLEARAVSLATRGPVLDAEPAGVDVAPFEAALRAGRVVVFPGFCGVGEDGATTLLGRGGSDLTALFLAEHLDARCVLVKDVDGLYERDPALPGPRPRRYARATWEEALRVGGKVVQPKTLHTARLAGRALEIRAIGASGYTRVGGELSCLEPAAAPRRLRVALLGLGTVGGGVYERLLGRPDLFEVVGAVVRDPARHAARGMPAALLATGVWSALAREPDVVVEALGGVDPAAEWLQAALLAGCRVVTANKAALAAHYDTFAPFLQGAAPRLRASAAVGGAVPMLETLARLAGETRVVGLRGVVNGTCNYVLDRLAAGVALDAAVREAQSAGYAEPDPGFDLSGRDAAHKLSLLVRALDRTAASFAVAGIDADTPAREAAARAAGRRLKLVATWDERGARVALEALAADDWLAGATAEENRLELQGADGRVERVHGRGAGRAPTATAVIADLLDFAADGERAAAAASAAA
jgi:homoserine dehydrogenase